MAQRSLFLGSPPFRFLADQLAQDEDFVSDTRAVLNISGESFDKLVLELTEFDGFLDRSALSEFVVRTLKKEEDPDAVRAVIWRLNRLVRASDESLADSLELLKAAINRHGEGLEDGERALLGERLDVLLAKPTGFARQHKAEQLAEATGMDLVDLQIICDVRPVFDDGRKRIEGAVPVSTLCLELGESDGRTSSVEVRLSEGQIADLCDKAESARRKVTLIKNMLGEKEITLPKTPATLDEGEDI